MTTTPSRVEGDVVAPLRVPTLAWALRRALLALLILTVTIAASACLLYASIDPDEETAPSITVPAEPHQSQPAAHPVRQTVMPQRV